MKSNPAQEAIERVGDAVDQKLFQGVGLTDAYRLVALDLLLSTDQVMFAHREFGRSLLKRYSTSGAPVDRQFLPLGSCELPRHVDRAHGPRKR
jgi:hypothetical protein